ncbi:protein bric-a-brac 1-like isoform X1 [Sitophilus oryzae]|uniref:Protein bric-a-brac 1-like isoform X1 n=1 Tax=Sitophilus oryzae TaxID=7048 RepID=A0A6J2XW39_SITOR|nr:protein bric-a-brac 1-like isoform X1 [Sitophilus oryzae]
MEVGDQFSLCWNNFHTNLSTGFHSLLEDEDLVDVTLAADGKYLKAHKTVLSVCSPFFKDLFRVNPCKHPIVILPDVNYEALKNLLHFMYHGEVSVSQEEIPTFMKVAETLRVKGLTDNTSDNTNGFQSASSYSDQKRNEYRKRSRPSRKLIRPLQSLRPLETPKPEPSQSPKLNPLPPPVPLVMPHPPKLVTPPPALSVAPPEEESLIQPSLGSPIENPLALIKPKEEIVDHSDTGSQGAMDENMELSSMLDIQLSGGEPSPSQLTPPWPAPPDSSGMGSNDDSQPGTIQCILGKRGNPRLIVDGHSFFKKSVYKGKVFWYCKSSRLTDKCLAMCCTMNGNIVKWPCPHNHPIIPDVFNPDEDTMVPIENLQEVLWQTSWS